MDPTGSFCQVVESTEASTEVSAYAIDGWVYLWEMADFEKAPYTDENKPLLQAIASQKAVTLAEVEHGKKRVAQPHLNCRVTLDDL